MASVETMKSEVNKRMQTIDEDIWIEIQRKFHVLMVDIIFHCIRYCLRILEIIYLKSI